MNSTPPLLDLLGVSWPVEAPVIAVAWDAHNRTLAGALDNGMLLLGDGVWQQGPTLVTRPGGGATVVAAREPAAAPLRLRAHANHCLAMRTDRLGGFLSGGDDGRLVHTSTAGNCSQLSVQRGQALAALDAGGVGLRAWATGASVHRSRLQQEECIDLPSAAHSLLFDPAGRCLAITHAQGLTLWSASAADDDSAAEPRHLALAGDPLGAVWSPDGRYLVVGTRSGELHAWCIADGTATVLRGPLGQPSSLSFSSDGRFLVASGALRPVAWRFDPLSGSEPPDECGIPGKTPVTQVACHPGQALIAAGYHNGAIALCQPGSADVLVVKDSGPGAVTALAWSGDGSRLAFGTQDACLGWVNLPPALFRNRATH